MWHSGQALAKAKSRSITAMIRRLDSSGSSEHDLTLTQWIAHIDKDPEARSILEEIQRTRWLARKVANRWRQRRWPVQCNVDMIDMKPVPDADAILMTDTKRRTIYRFHSRDVFANLISNIGMSEEMLPSPRPPANPWTNAPLTFAQTVGVCEQLVRFYGKKGKCPPVLFAAFCAARFHLRRFYEQNSILLAQHAITSYFKDLHQHNEIVVLDTITILLTAAGLDYSAVAIRKWLRQPRTPLHQEWLTMVRDYTLYINLRVQIRSTWISSAAIYVDVRALYARTTLPSATSQRFQYMNMVEDPDIIPPHDQSFGMLTLPSLLHIISNEALTEQFLAGLLAQSFSDPLSGWNGITR